MADTAYKFYLVQVTLGKTLYLTGEVDGRYLVTTDKVDQAVDVYVETVDGGVKFYILVGEEKQYITVYNNESNKLSVKFDAAGTSVYTYNATVNAWVTNLDGTDYYLGTYSNFNTVSASKLSYITADNTGVSQFPAGFATLVAKKVAPKPVTTPVADTAYKFYLVQVTLGKNLYLTGEVDGRYLVTTDKISKAVDVYVETVDGGVKLYILVGEEKQYITVYNNESNKLSVKFDAAGTSVYTYNATVNAWVTNLDGTDYYLGTYSNFNTVSASKLSYITADNTGVSQFPAGLATIEVVAENEEPTPEEPTPEVCEHDYVEGVCSKCGETDPNYVPPVVEKNVITIPEALAIATAQGDTYTTEKYYITGIVKNISNTYYGNFYLVDAEGNELYVYGLKDATGAGNFSGLDPQPAVGDTLTIYTVLGCYYGSPQAKDAWFYELVQHTEHDWTEASCKAAKTCTVCGKVEGEPLEHVYVDGSCTGCGKDEPVQGTVVTNTEVFAGLTAAGQYKTVTTTSGWTAENAAVLTGGNKDANPVFQFIGSTADTVAICLNGKTATVGKLTSATLQGGISKLSFSYGNAFSESKGVDITINILQGGAVVATTTLDNDSVSQKTAYDFVWELDNVVNGEFVIEIVNNCPSNNASSNKDRVAIFNFSWDSAPVAAA